MACCALFWSACPQTCTLQLVLNHILRVNTGTTVSLWKCSYWTSWYKNLIKSLHMEDLLVIWSWLNGIFYGLELAYAIILCMLILFLMSKVSTSYMDKYFMNSVNGSGCEMKLWFYCWTLVKQIFHIKILWHIIYFIKGLCAQYHACCFLCSFLNSSVHSLRLRIYPGFSNLHSLCASFSSPCFKLLSVQ